MSSSTNTTGYLPNWASLIASARKEHQAGGGSVLDALARLWRGAPDDMTLQMKQQTGVAELAEPHKWSADFSLFSSRQARENKCLVLTANNIQVIAAADPWNENSIRKLHRILPERMEIFAVYDVDLQEWLGHEDKHTAKTEVISTPSNMSVSGPIVSFVDVSILRAMENGASDIHVECDRSGVTIKHRLDGVIQQFSRMEGVQNAREVISRIKVLAQLDITESRLPQDGRFRFDNNSASMDLRVSIMPSVHGEDAVLRLLDKAQWRREKAIIDLNALGFADCSAKHIRDMAMEPSGMLLVTGPTGSGKTTTLYAVLSEINSGLEKIVTIEDPVEYELEGVLQIPVNERKGLTFAKGLRSILRHDPDRILVGEIRDGETAEIAVQASLTGHQVFTTVHANNIADVVGRFRHFGLDMFGFTSSLNGVIVQRLIRKLCTHCKELIPISPEQLIPFVRYNHSQPASLYRPIGCDECNHAGYSGRFVLAEIHQIDDHFRDLVTSGAPLTTLKQHVRQTEVGSLQFSALAKVAEGMTTLEEVQRVVGSFKGN